jgi:hypothetical protein
MQPVTLTTQLTDIEQRASAEESTARITSAMDETKRCLRELGELEQKHSGLLAECTQLNAKADKLDGSAESRLQVARAQSGRVAQKIAEKRSELGEWCDELRRAIAVADKAIRKACLPLLDALREQFAAALAPFGFRPVEAKDVAESSRPYAEFSAALLMVHPLAANLGPDSLFAHARTRLERLEALLEGMPIWSLPPTA